MKRIVFIHLLNDYSGSPKVLSQVIAAYQNAGGEAELSTGYSSDGFLSNLTKQHQFYFYRRFENKYLTLFSFFLSQCILLFKLLRYYKQDIIIYINTLLPFGAAIAGKIIGKPVYYHIHEISLRPAILKRFLRFIVNITASKVIFVSHAVRDAEFFANKQQSVVTNALPNNFIQHADNHLYQWRYNNCFNVLMICSLKTYKGILEFIDLAERLQLQSHIHFILVLNANESEIDRFFSNINKPNNLTLVPRQTDIRPFYQKASLLLNLSRIDEWVETFGLTIAEALAFGIPVIVPPVGGPAEIVNDGIEGYLISSYEVEKIAHIILDLSNDKQKCEKLSQHAKKRAMDFREEIFSKHIMQVICE